MTAAFARNFRSPRLFGSSAPFSHVVFAQGFGFVSGLIGQSPETGEVVSDDVAGQTRQMLANLDTLLEDVGASRRQVVRATLYLLDYVHFQEINAIWSDYFGAIQPARVTLATAGLPLGAAVQVDAILEHSGPGA